MPTATDLIRPIASVAFLAIPDFAQRSIAEQAQMRGQVEQVVAAAIGKLRQEERIVLDAPHGAAIVVLGNAPGALAAAENAHAQAKEGKLPLAIGLHHGYIREAADARNESVIAGDGLETAALVAGFGKAGSLLMSRDFRDLLARQAPDLAEGSRPAGRFTDARLRAHEIFAFDRVNIHASGRRLLIVGAMACACVLALGLAANLVLEGIREASQPAWLQFEVRPPGDIYVDGAPVGRTSEISRFKLRAGEHTVEIRSGRYPPYVLQVKLEPGEQRLVKHSFASPVPRKKGLIDRLKFWQ